MLNWVILAWLGIFVVLGFSFQWFVGLEIDVAFVRHLPKEDGGFLFDPVIREKKRHRVLHFHRCVRKIPLQFVAWPTVPS